MIIIFSIIFFLYLMAYFTLKTKKGRRIALLIYLGLVVICTVLGLVWVE